MPSHKHIEDLISQGESQYLDFKYNISDSRKIAKSLVAFSNTEGGKLLIGVRDNGSIAGITSDEELFMIEAAANMYSNPQISFDTKEWQINGKVVLEITVPESIEKPHSAQEDDGKWLVYIRYNDKNILANIIMIEVWKRQNRKEGIRFRYLNEEKILLDYLKKNENITLPEYLTLTKCPRYIAIRTLVNLIILDVIKINITEKVFSYSLK